MKQKKICPPPFIFLRAQDPGSAEAREGEEKETGRRMRTRRHKKGLGIGFLWIAAIPTIWIWFSGCEPGGENPAAKRRENRPPVTLHRVEASTIRETLRGIGTLRAGKRWNTGGLNPFCRNAEKTLVPF